MTAFLKPALKIALRHDQNDHKDCKFAGVDARRRVDGYGAIEGGRPCQRDLACGRIDRVAPVRQVIEPKNGARTAKRFINKNGELFRRLS